MCHFLRVSPFENVPDVPSQTCYTLELIFRRNGYEEYELLRTRREAVSEATQFLEDYFICVNMVRDVAQTFLLGPP